MRRRGPLVRAGLIPFHRLHIEIEQRGEREWRRRKGERGKRKGESKREEAASAMLEASTEAVVSVASGVRSKRGGMSVVESRAICSVGQSGDGAAVARCSGHR